LAPAFHAISDSRPPDADAGRPATRALGLLEDAIAARASDIHLDSHGAHYCIRFRVDGALHDVAMIDRDEGERFLRYFRTKAELGPPKPHEPQNGRIHLEIHGEAWEIRLSSAPAVLGEKAALRLLNRRHLDRRISDLGMAEETLDAISAWTEDSSGMLLVAGPTGSGKTTTITESKTTKSPPPWNWSQGNVERANHADDQRCKSIRGPGPTR